MVQTLTISIGSIILGFDGILYFIISLLAFSRLKGPNHLGSLAGSQPHQSTDSLIATPASFKPSIYVKFGLYIVVSCNYFFPVLCDNVTHLFPFCSSLRADNIPFHIQGG